MSESTLIYAIRIIIAWFFFTFKYRLHVKLLIDKERKKNIHTQNRGYHHTIVQLICHKKKKNRKIDFKAEQCNEAATITEEEGNKQHSHLMPNLS